jgi:hypothetical protein
MRRGHYGTWGSIASSGRVATETLNWQADAVGPLKLSYEYMNRLAASVPGAHVKQTPRPLGWYVAKGPTPITIEDLLAYEDGWLDDIQSFTRAAKRSA